MFPMKQKPGFTLTILGFVIATASALLYKSYPHQFNSCIARLEEEKPASEVAGDSISIPDSVKSNPMIMGALMDELLTTIPNITAMERSRRSEICREETEWAETSGGYGFLSGVLVLATGVTTMFLRKKSIFYFYQALKDSIVGAQAIGNQGSSVTSKLNIINDGGIHNLGNISIGQGATVVGGDLSGRVTTSINALSPSSDPNSPGIKELLSQLHEAIEKEFGPNQKSKEKALKQLEVLAEAAKHPNTKKDDADNATLIVRGLSAGAAILTIIDKVRAYFGLG